MKEVNLFPYETFGFRLEHKDDGKVCWFLCQEHLDKYIERHNLKPKEIKLDYKDGKPNRTRKTHKRNLEQKSQPKSNRSASPVRKRGTRMDSNRNTSSNDKTSGRKRKGMGKK